MACEWREDSSGDYWTAQCGGELFCFNDGGPVENGMCFCCYCGAALVPVSQMQQTDADDDVFDNQDSHS
jgi:hypothetical protein